VPLKPGLSTRTAHGEHAVSQYVIVRVHTDTPLVGLGEATVAPRWSGETSSGTVALIRELLAPARVGHEALDLNANRAIMDREVKLNPFTKAGIEMALWDLKGKATGQSVAQLLGGKVRDTIPIKLVVGAFDVPAAVHLAKRFLDWGVRALKVKVGLDPAEDLARVQAVRELAGNDIPIGIDANCGWTLSTARQMLEEMRPYNLLFAEQPIPPGDAAALAELRSTTTVPIMADESVFTLSDAWNLCRANAVDIFSIYPGKHGGLAASVEIANVASAAGIVCAIGSNLELGIGTAAMLHLAAALPNVASERFPADTIGPIYHESDLLVHPLALGPPGASIPSGPGLGVELDEAQLDRYRERADENE
jgi:muconate cycloisomerase